MVKLMVEFEDEDEDAEELISYLHDVFDETTAKFKIIKSHGCYNPHSSYLKDVKE